MTRRDLLRAAAGTGTAVLGLYGASDFWNRKQPSEWTGEQIGQLTTHSPWAKEVNAEFQQDVDYGVAGAGGPNVGPGGAVRAPGSEQGSPGQFEIGTPKDAPGGAKRREPVTIRWESAQPILDATGKPLPRDFDSRYVISVSGLPLGVMDGRRRPRGSPAPVEDGGQTRQSRMIEQLMASAVLDARGREPVQAGVVEPARGAPATYLFGFSKELLPLTASDREVQFTLKTGFIELKAKFEPKEMMYRGHLAL